jgi:uncharacterized protein (TIGR02594 family)
MAICEIIYRGLAVIDNKGDVNMMKLNENSHKVREIQLLLNSHLIPSPCLKVDGYFGTLTYQAVINFQTKKGLTPDGHVGPKTLIALGLKEVLVPVVQHIITSFSPWMDIATAELGVHEDSLPGQHNARIIEYHQTTSLKATDDETPWCSSFVNWVMLKSGRRGTNSAVANSWLGWGTGVVNPTIGVITVIKKKMPGFSQATGSQSGFHVGFFVSLTQTHLRLLGGNQSNQVKYSNFSLANFEIRGYRQPS